MYMQVPLFRWLLISIIDDVYADSLVELLSLQFFYSKTLK